MTSHNVSSYAVLPSFIMDDDNLEEGAKILYARISMYSQEGRCWASNNHFAEKQKVTTRCIQLWLKQLSDCGYIEVEIIKEGFQTKRNIWIISDFKKMFTKRTTVHPDAKCSSPRHEPQFTHININKTNIKDKREAKPPRSLFGSHVLLYEKEYAELCEKYGKDKLDKMIQKINLGIDSKGYKYKCFVATIHNWFEKEKNFEPVANEKKNMAQKNSEWAHENFKNGEVTKGYTVSMDSTGITFYHGQSFTSFKFTDNGFVEQVKNMFRKR